MHIICPTANTANGRCNKCTSSSSWHDCTNRQVAEDCPSGEEQCAQFLTQAYDPVIGSKKASYLKGCASKSVCQRPQTSKVCRGFRWTNSGARISCQVFCSGNLSNERKPPGIDQGARGRRVLRKVFGGAVRSDQNLLFSIPYFRPMYHAALAR